MPEIFTEYLFVMPPSMCQFHNSTMHYHENINKNKTSNKAQYEVYMISNMESNTKSPVLCRVL